MKKTNITIAYAEEKLAALNLYLSQKTLTVEEPVELLIIPRTFPLASGSLLSCGPGSRRRLPAHRKPRSQSPLPLLLWARFPQPRR